MNDPILPPNSEQERKMPELDTLEHPKLEMADEFHVKHAHKYVFVYVFIVLLLGVTGAVYAWQHKKVTEARTRNAALQTKVDDLNKKLSNGAEQSTQKAKAVTPDASWKTFCDTRHSECFKYPADWTLQNSSSTEFPYTIITLTNPAKSITVNYTNVFVKDGFSTRFHTNVVADLVPAVSELKIVGGYTYGSTRYLPTIGVMNATSAPKAGRTTQLGIAQIFTDKDKSTAQFSAGAAGFTTAADADDWFNTADAQTALAILQSLYYK